MPPKSEYTAKIENPFSVRLSKDAHRGLGKLRRSAGRSEGDMVEWLLRETDPLKVVKRNRGGELTERVSFRISETGNDILRNLMDAHSVSGGDVVEAYILRSVK